VAVKRNAFGSLVCVIALFVMAQPAFAHARLVSSTPQADGVLHGPAIAIDLRFDSRVDGSRSRLDLVSPDGRIEALKISAPGDAELAAHAGLGPGKYTIRWQALSTDGHITRGEIPFTVR
jgi:copper resistance protein C